MIKRESPTRLAYNKIARLKEAHDCKLKVYISIIARIAMSNDISKSNLIVKFHLNISSIMTLHLAKIWHFFSGYERKKDTITGMMLIKIIGMKMPLSTRIIVLLNPSLSSSSLCVSRQVGSENHSKNISSISKNPNFIILMIYS